MTPAATATLFLYFWVLVWLCGHTLVCFIISDDSLVEFVQCVGVRAVPNCVVPKHIIRVDL